MLTVLVKLLVIITYIIACIISYHGLFFLQSTQYNQILINEHGSAQFVGMPQEKMAATFIIYISK